MGESAWQRSEGCADGNCVEILFMGDDRVLLRSSLEPATVLRLTSAEWSAFRIAMERGDFDRPL